MGKKDGVHRNVSSLLTLNTTIEGMNFAIEAVRAKIQATDENYYTENLETIYFHYSIKANKANKELFNT